MPAAKKNIVVGRPFVKGQSGNPSGRRKGSVSVAAAIRRAVTKQDADDLARKLISMAKSGNMAAMKLLLERTDGHATHVHIEHDMED